MAKIGFSLNDCWLILRKRKWIAVFTFLIVFAATVFHTQSQTPIYKATCSIRLIERQSVTDMITSTVSHTSYSMMSSLTKVLTGRPIIEKVVYEMGLVDEKITPSELENLILGVQSFVQTQNEPMTNIVLISVEHSDPVMAANLPNTIANVFIKVDMDEKTERARNIRIFIEDQLAKLQKGLTEAEDKLKLFREQGEEQAAGIVMAIQNNVSTLEKQKMELLKIYTAKYPDVVKITEQIEDLKKELQSLSQTEIDYARIIREYEVTEKSYRLLQGKLEDARIAEAEKTQDVKIVNPATVPKTPIKPRKDLAMTLGLIVGIVLGAFIAFVVEALDTPKGEDKDL